MDMLATLASLSSQARREERIPRAPYLPVEVNRLHPDRIGLSHDKTDLGAILPSRSMAKPKVHKKRDRGTPEHEFSNAAEHDALIRSHKAEARRAQMQRTRWGVKRAVVVGYRPDPFK